VNTVPASFITMGKMTEISQWKKQPRSSVGTSSCLYCMLGRFTYVHWPVFLVICRPKLFC